MNSQISEARSRAISHIGIGYSSSGRVRSYLTDSGYDEDTVDEVILQMKEDGYVDDERMAYSILRKRSGTKTEGKRASHYRLSGMGIPDDVIQSILSKSEYDDAVTIRTLITARYDLDEWRKFTNDQLNHELARAIRFLGGRGYSSNLALASFRKLLVDVQ
ncbi:MAG TPA: regulatory protein RecX [Bacillota bacterium]|nr:regulatory protein RecX [Bacillota bacterium]